jgi:hypothetical protein
MILRLPHKHPRIMTIPRDSLPAILRHDSIPLLQCAPKLHYHLILPRPNDSRHIDPVAAKHVLALEDGRPVQRDGRKRVEALEHKTYFGSHGRRAAEGCGVNPCVVVYPLRGALVEAEVWVGDREIEVNVGRKGGGRLGVVRGGGEMSGCEGAFEELHLCGRGTEVGAGGGGGVLGH